MKKNNLTNLLLVTVASIVATVTPPASAQDGVWATHSPMPTARKSFGLGEAGGKLFALGGAGTRFTCSYLSANEAYDVANNSWSIRAPMPTSRESLGVAGVNGIIYAVGGGTGCGSFTPVVEAYDPITDSWTTKAPLPAERTVPAVAVVDGILYVIGGYSYSGYTTTVFAYDPATDTWTSRAPVPSLRGYNTATAVNGLVYLAGGIDLSTGNPDGALLIYDPLADRWRAGAQMLSPRYNVTAASAGGFLYAIGGQSSSAYLDTVEAYDPATDLWTAVASAPTIRVGSASAAVNDVIYTMGGENQFISPFSINESFAPFIETPEFDFVGFVSPIGGADSTGGSFESPVRTFKMGSSIPVKFVLFSGDEIISTGAHTLQAIKYSNATTYGAPLDATPTDAATEGNQFRFDDGQWHFNLDTRAAGMSVGIWQLIATLSNGSQHNVWIQLK